eukprot:Rhum_TRINITY_DN14409_c10_g3::Rhum_TRINITY_DN14409_c10_g3_i1::g.88377::m.88377
MLRRRGDSGSSSALRHSHLPTTDGGAPALPPLPPPPVPHDTTKTSPRDVPRNSVRPPTSAQVTVCRRRPPHSQMRVRPTSSSGDALPPPPPSLYTETMPSTDTTATHPPATLRTNAASSASLGTRSRSTSRSVHASNTASSRRRTPTKTCASVASRQTVAGSRSILRRATAAAAADGASPRRGGPRHTPSTVHRVRIVCSGSLAPRSVTSPFRCSTHSSVPLCDAHSFAATRCSCMQDIVASAAPPRRSDARGGAAPAGAARRLGGDSSSRCGAAASRRRSPADISSSTAGSNRSRRPGLTNGSGDAGTRGCGSGGPLRGHA